MGAFYQMHYCDVKGFTKDFPALSSKLNVTGFSWRDSARSPCPRDTCAAGVPGAITASSIRAVVEYALFDLSTRYSMDPRNHFCISSSVASTSCGGFSAPCDRAKRRAISDKDIEIPWTAGISSAFNASSVCMRLSSAEQMVSPLRHFPVKLLAFPKAFSLSFE